MEKTKQELLKELEKIEKQEKEKEKNDENYVATFLSRNCLLDCFIRIDYHIFI